MFSVFTEYHSPQPDTADRQIFRHRNLSDITKCHKEELTCKPMKTRTQKCARRLDTTRISVPADETARPSWRDRPVLGDLTVCISMPLIDRCPSEAQSMVWSTVVCRHAHCVGSGLRNIRRSPAQLREEVCTVYGAHCRSTRGRRILTELFQHGRLYQPAVVTDGQGVRFSSRSHSCTHYRVWRC